MKANANDNVFLINFFKFYAPLCYTAVKTYKSPIYFYSGTPKKRYRSVKLLFLYFSDFLFLYAHKHTVTDISNTKRIVPLNTLPVCTAVPDADFVTSEPDVEEVAS